MTNVIFGDAAVFFIATVIAVIASIFGSSMFLTAPLLQIAFPEATLAGVSANIRTGSLLRSTAILAVNMDGIQRSLLLRFVPALLAGAILATLVSVEFSQAWLIAVTVLAIAVSENAKYLKDRIRYLIVHEAVAFAIGFYGVFSGAGSGFLLIAFFRVQLSADKEVGLAIVHARCFEFGIALVALLKGILDGGGWPTSYTWLAGTLFGGLIGGALLKLLRSASSQSQRLVLLAAYVFAVVTALLASLDVVSIFPSRIGQSS